MSLEPFLVNPPRRKLIVVNPKRKKKSSKKSKRLFRRRSSKMARRKRSRKNPVILGSNPRRKRHSRRRNPVVLGSNPRRRGRRHYRSNPGILSKIQMPSMSHLGWLAVGAVGASTLTPMTFRMFPITASRPWIRILTRVGVVALISTAAKMAKLKQHSVIRDGAIVAQVIPVTNEVLGMFNAPMRLSQDSGDEIDQISMFTEDQNQDMSLYTEEPQISVG